MREKKLYVTYIYILDIKYTVSITMDYSVLSFKLIHATHLLNNKL